MHVHVWLFDILGSVEFCFRSWNGCSRVLLWGRTCKMHDLFNQSTLPLEIRLPINRKAPRTYWETSVIKQPLFLEVTVENVPIGSCWSLGFFCIANIEKTRPHCFVLSAAVSWHLSYIAMNVRHLLPYSKPLKFIPESLKTFKFHVPPFDLNVIRHEYSCARTTKGRTVIK